MSLPVDDSQLVCELWTRRRVEFSDTDLSGLIHFSRFLVYMETAEHEFLKAAGSSVDLALDDRRLGWPRLSCGCEYKSPARFEDVLDVRVFVLRKGSKSLTFGCEMLLDGVLVARGQMSSACCIIEPESRPRPVDIPAPLAERIGEVSEEERQAWKSPIRPL